MQRTRTYECMCLLDNREVRKGWQPLKDAVTGLFTKHGAKIVSARRWDERRLAYTIKGQSRGTYLLVYFSGDTQSVAAVRRDLQFSEALLRYLLVDCEEVPQSAYEPEGEFDYASIPVEDTPDMPESSEAEASGDEASGDAEATPAEDGAEAPATVEAGEEKES